MYPAKEHTKCPDLFTTNNIKGIKGGKKVQDLSNGTGLPARGYVKRTPKNSFSLHPEITILV